MFFYFDAIYYLILLLIFTMGAFVVFNNPKSKTGWIFFLFIVGAIGWLTSLYLGWWYTDYALWDDVLFWMRSSYGFSVWGMSLMTIFIYFFPNRTFILPRAIEIGYLLLTISLFVLASFTPMINKALVIENGIYIKDIFGPLYFIYVADILLNLAASAYLSIKKLKNTQGVEKEKMVFVAFGYLAFVGLAVSTNVILPLFGIFIMQKESPMLILVFIISAYYAIQRFRFFHLSYLSLKFIRDSFLLAVYILITVFAYKFLTFYFPPAFDLISLVISVLLGIGIYIYSKSIFPQLLGFGFKEFKNTLAEFKSKIFHCDTYPKLLKIIENVFLVKLNFVQAKLLVIRREKFETNIPIYPYDDFTKALTKFKKDVLIYDEIRFRKLNEKTKRILRMGMQKLEADLCIPLHSENNLIGFSALKKKEGAKPYSEEMIKEILSVKKDLEICLMNILLKMNLQEENDLMKIIISEKTKQLRKQYEAIKELLGQQSDFIALTAHELRTPLSVALFQVEETLEAKNKSTSLKNDLNNINNSLNNLKELTEKLFSVQQYDLKKAKIYLEKIKIKKWILSIYKDFKKIMKEKNISFELKDSIKKERNVKMDKSQMHQVLGNLLNNAYKFTPSNGEITLGIEIKNKHLFITVQDSGPGVPTKFKKSAFDKFKTQHKGNGIGLGLYICKKIVELHKGKICIENAQNGGALFHVQLPL